MARESATNYGIYIGVTGAGKERSRCEDIDMVRQTCLLTTVSFPPDRGFILPTSAHIAGIWAGFELQIQERVYLQGSKG